MTCNQIKRSETLGSSISSNTDSNKSRVGRSQGRDGDCQTEEVRLWCANCDAKVRIISSLQDNLQ